MSQAAMANVHDAHAAGAIAFTYEGEPRMTAGALQRWTLRFAARIDLPSGARVAVAHRWPSDWGIAQASEPAGVDYLEAETSAGTSVRCGMRACIPGSFDHILFVELPDGLAAGDSLALRYGEGTIGLARLPRPTFIEEASPFSLRGRSATARPGANSSAMPSRSSARNRSVLSSARRRESRPASLSRYTFASRMPGAIRRTWTRPSTSRSPTGDPTRSPSNA